MYLESGVSPSIPRRFSLPLLAAVLLLLGLLLLLKVLEEGEPVGERLHLRHVGVLPGDVVGGGGGVRPQVFYLPGKLFSGVVRCCGWGKAYFYSCRVYSALLY